MATSTLAELALPRLDLFSVKFATLVTTLAVSLSIALASRINRPVAGMKQFAAGLVTICLGSALGMSRLLIPGFAVMIAGNVFTVAGLMGVVAGIRKFRDFEPLHSLSIWIFSAVVALPFFYWMFLHDDFGRRVGVISFAMALLSFEAMACMLRRVPSTDRMTYLPTALAFAFSALFLTVRAIVAITGHYGTNFLTPVPIEIPLSLCAGVAFVGCGFGMLLASNTQMRDAAERMALFDPLTNLPNRRMLVDRLRESEVRAVANNCRIGVIYLDLDGFKLVNDTLGHEAGDKLLRNAGVAMAAILRPGDCLARVGGDEFVVVVEAVNNRAELSALAARLKTAVETANVPGDALKAAHVSCGVAVFPDDGQTAHDVMREADMAMYHAKRQQRVAHLAGVA